MPYRILDWQRRALAAALELVPAWPAPMGFAREFAARNLAAMAPKQPRLREAVRLDAGPGVTSAVVQETPFARIVRFAIPGGRRRRSASTPPPIFLLAPHSGYATSVLSPLVAAALLPAGGEVWVTEWRDARLVPTSAGRLDVGSQVRLAAELIAAIGRPAHLVGVSQSGPPLLAAATLAAKRARALRPASLALLGSQVDPWVMPHAYQTLLASWPRALVTGRLTAAVPDGHPGEGRRVYPGLLLLALLGTASPEAYLGIQLGLLLDLLSGSDNGFARAHADVHDIIDVPAELFRDMLDWAVFRPGLEGRRMRLGRRSFDLSSLAGVPLLTAEAAADELVGPGQTHAAGMALGAAANGRHVRYDMPGGRHPDLFTGPLFLSALAPALRSFLVRAGAAAK